MATSLKSKPRTQPESAPVDSGRYAALYVRVSTGKQKENWSVQDQRALTRLGTERGFRVVAYEEQGVSGETIEARPVMQRLLEDVRAGKVRAIICVATNRLSRDEDIIDTLVIQKTCREHDTLVITPEQTFNYAERTDTMFGQIRAIFDADQKQALVKATTRGQYAKARAGGWTGGIPPFGYRVVFDIPHGDGRARGRLTVDEAEAQIVRLIYRLYTEGKKTKGETVPMSMQAIAPYLNAKGYRFTTRRTQKETGNQRHDGTVRRAGEQRDFEPQDVRRILTGRYYLGLFGRGEGQLSKWMRDEGPVEVTLPHLQIVDVDTWQRAQAIRTQRSTMPRRTACSPRPLVGLLRCPECEGMMSSHILIQRRGGEQRDYFGYHCRNRRAFGRDRCKGFQISERAARAAVEDELIASLRALQLRRYLDRGAEVEATASEGEIAQTVMVELQQTETKLQRLIEAVAEGVFTPAEARAKKLELMEKKQRLEARLKKLQGRASARQDIYETIERVEANLPVRVRELDGAQFRSLAGMVFKQLTVVGEGTSRARVAHVRDSARTERFKEIASSFECYVDAYHSNEHLDRGPLAEVLAVLAA